MFFGIRGVSELTDEGNRAKRKNERSRSTQNAGAERHSPKVSLRRRAVAKLLAGTVSQKLPSNLGTPVFVEIPTRIWQVRCIPTEMVVVPGRRDGGYEGKRQQTPGPALVWTRPRNSQFRRWWRGPPVSPSQRPMRIYQERKGRPAEYEDGDLRCIAGKFMIRSEICHLRLCDRYPWTSIQMPSLNLLEFARTSSRCGRVEVWHSRGSRLEHIYPLTVER